MLTPGENPQDRKFFSSEGDRTRDAALRRTESPAHYQGAIPAPGGQRFHEEVAKKLSTGNLPAS